MQQRADCRPPSPSPAHQAASASPPAARAKGASADTARAKRSALPPAAACRLCAYACAPKSCVPACAGAAKGWAPRGSDGCCSSAATEPPRAGPSLGGNSPGATGPVATQRPYDLNCFLLSTRNPLSAPGAILCIESHNAAPCPPHYACAPGAHSRAGRRSPPARRWRCAPAPRRAREQWPAQGAAPGGAARQLAAARGQPLEELGSPLVPQRCLGCSPSTRRRCRRAAAPRTALRKRSSLPCRMAAALALYSAEPAATVFTCARRQQQPMPWLQPGPGAGMHHDPGAGNAAHLLHNFDAPRRQAHVLREAVRTLLVLRRGKGGGRGRRRLEPLLLGQRGAGERGGVRRRVDVASGVHLKQQRGAQTLPAAAGPAEGQRHTHLVGDLFLPVQLEVGGARVRPDRRRPGTQRSQSCTHSSRQGGWGRGASDAEQPTGRSTIPRSLTHMATPFVVHTPGNGIEMILPSEIGEGGGARWSTLAQHTPRTFCNIQAQDCQFHTVWVSAIQCS